MSFIYGEHYIIHNVFKLRFQVNDYFLIQLNVNRNSRYFCKNDYVSIFLYFPNLNFNENLKIFEF